MGLLEYLFDVIFVGAALISEELDAISIWGQMAGCEHASTIKIVRGQNGCHEHGWRGGKCDICDGSVLIGSTDNGSIEKGGTCDTGVTSQSDADVGGRF